VCAVTIAAAFWLTGIIGLFTGAIEKIEFVSLYAQPAKKDSARFLMKNGRIGTTTLSPGVSIEVKFHVTGGREYPKLTTLL
jgi:hypothetical protein